MNGFVANTDYDWYDFLRRRPDLEEVNFWQPSGRHSFRALTPGQPFFFKLKKPHYAIGGYGIYLHHSILPAWLAWECFAEANGAPSFHAMVDRIKRYRPGSSDRLDPNHRVGCLMISRPVFFEEGQWIDQPGDWKKNIVQGKTYDMTRDEGRRIYEQCRVSALLKEVYRRESGSDRYGEAVLVQPRLGQGTFRVGVLDAYGRSCAVTTEHSLPVLEAAHIKPYSEGGEHNLRNGLLLRSDIHRLFDRGYVTVTPEHHFVVSRRLRDHYENGRTYYPHDGERIHLPTDEINTPQPQSLQWHNENCFLG